MTKRTHTVKTYRNKNDYVDIEEMLDFIYENKEEKIIHSQEMLSQGYADIAPPQELIGIYQRRKNLYKFNSIKTQI